MPSSVLGKINMSAYNIDQDICYLNLLPKQSEEYDEFGQGYWKNVSLMNGSGKSEDTQYKNSEMIIETPHLKKCNGIKKIDI